MLALLKEEANFTRTENGALTYRSSQSACLDLFATVGALRAASDAEIADRFLCAYAEDADCAMKILFYARDVRGGLGERRVFRVLLRWLAENEPASLEKNVPHIAEYGRWDDLLTLLGTPCEAAALACIRRQLAADRAALESGAPVSLLAKWLPSVNASSAQTVRQAKHIARALALREDAYRRLLSALRARIALLENSLRERDYTFDYEKQPSRALYKYRRAFLRNDGARYGAFLARVERGEAQLHTGTLTPCDVVAPLLGGARPDAAARRTLNATWNALEDFTGGENALVVADGSGSMYCGGEPLPAAVALSLALYFAERNTGAFRNHFITFSEHPRLVEIRGRDIAERVRSCSRFNEIANTNLERVFILLLRTALRGSVPQRELPTRLYVISDMEFDECVEGGAATNFSHAQKLYAAHGYRLPEVVFWNVASRTRQQPVRANDAGAVLVSGCSPRIFAMLREGTFTPAAFMHGVLAGERYAPIAA